MEEEVTRIVIENNGILKSFCWLSLQKDNSISVGMSDKTFVVPSIRVSTKPDKKAHVSSIDYEKKYTLGAIQNPHFTFHPACWYHLRANKQNPLFSGLLMVDMVVNDSGYLPWIRYISNPVKTLKSFQNQSRNEVLNIL